MNHDNDAGDGSNGPNVLTGRVISMRRGRLVRPGRRRRELPAGEQRGWQGELQEHLPRGVRGRWPHIHFEVYRSLEAATSAGSKLKTSQIALPKDACDLVYAAEGYEQSVQNLAQTSLDTDNVFSDGYASQLATTSGTVGSRMAIKLNVGV